MKKCGVASQVTIVVPTEPPLGAIDSAALRLESVSGNSKTWISAPFTWMIYPATSKKGCSTSSKSRTFAPETFKALIRFS